MRRRAGKGREREAEKGREGQREGGEGQRRAEREVGKGREGQRRAEKGRERGREGQRESREREVEKLGGGGFSRRMACRTTVGKRHANAGCYAVDGWPRAGSHP